jgi:hypothetical protein
VVVIQFGFESAPLVRPDDYPLGSDPPDEDVNQLLERGFPPSE